MSKNLLFAVILVLFSVVSRFLPHPVNFTPVIAVGLFSGFLFQKSPLRYLVPLFSMIISDYFIGFYDGIIFTYFAILFSVWIGSKISMEKFQFHKVFGGAIASSLSFFFITNLAVWYFSDLYPHSWIGLVTCFEMAIPFYQNSLAGDLIYSSILFFAWFEIAKRSSFVLQNHD